MKLIYPIFFLAIFVLGAYIGVRSFIRSKKIFSGVEKKTGRILVNSALAGLSITFLFFGGVNFFEAIDLHSYQFQLKDIAVSFALFLIPGFIVFIGSIWQFFQVGILREALLKYFKKRGNNEKRN